MKKRIVMLLTIAITLILLCSCIKADNSDLFTTTDNFVYQTAPTSTPYTPETVTTADTYYTEIPAEATSTTAFVAEIITEAEPATTHYATQQNTTTETAAPAPTTEKELKKTGDMAFSDSADNKYLKAVADKYNLNSNNLVAIYTVPDNDGNIVLEFDGSTDSNGKLIRNKESLIAIYSIDKNLVSKRASENPLKNEYSYGEMKVMFITTTQYIMPEFESELKG